MRRCKFVSVTLLTMACAMGEPGGQWAAGQEPARPNIVLIMADDLGAESIGSYGSANYDTPRLDELASTGVRFTQCYSYPLCTPSRVAIMTGRHNDLNYEAFGVLPPTERTFAHMLRDAGYATGVVGKWQLYGRQEGWEGKGATPEQAGFDQYCLWQIVERGKRYADPVIKKKGEPLRTYEEAYGPDIFTDYAIDFMKANKDEPFFLYFPMCLTHTPFVPTPLSDGWDGDRYDDKNKYFADMVAYTDHIVGRLVDALDAIGERDNTVVMFTGDNGTHGRIESTMRDGSTIRGAKGKPTKAGTHVPFIVNWPDGIDEEKERDALISFVDFVPTLAELADAELPDDRMIDGRSFLGLLTGQSIEERDWIYCDYAPDWGSFEPSRYVQDTRWKLYDSGEFYEFQRDPLEERPLAVEGLVGDAAQAYETLRNALEHMKSRTM